MASVSSYYMDDIYRMMGKPIHSVLIELAYHYYIIMTWYWLILDLTLLLQHLRQPIGMLINLTLLFDLLIDHTLYTDIDNGVSTDDIYQQWCHKDAMCL